MKVHLQLLKYWDRIHSSFWFVPTVMTSAAAAIAFTCVALDKSITDGWLESWAYPGGAEGASMVLGTIAGSMVTIAGVVFSITLLALSLASSQLGPRLLSNFMRSTTNQVVLGTFVATFVYCLLVLRTIRRAGDEGAFVPHFAISLGVIFAVASVGVLIYFIHHVSISIQADEVVARVSKELNEGINRLFPQRMGQAPSEAVKKDPEGEIPANFARESRPIAAATDGYIQRIDTDELMALATREDVLIRLERRPGHYVVAGSALARVWPQSRVSATMSEQINATFVLGHQRTSAQDIEFCLTQLVEIAVRALSPGINDPFTAMACVDRLGSALCRLAQRDMPSPYRFDPQQRLRVLTVPVSFAGIVDTAFTQIRQYARTSTGVNLRLLETIAVIAEVLEPPLDRATLLKHATLIAQSACENAPTEDDRQAVEGRFQVASQALHHPPS